MNVTVERYKPGDDALDKVYNPPTVFEGEENIAWPDGAQVDPPRPFPTLSHWIQDFRHRLDHHRTTTTLPETADVVIIGSGLTGCSAAYHLLKEIHNTGTNVVMLEARAFCSGATARNGGHMYRPEGFDARADSKSVGVDMFCEIQKFFRDNRDSKLAFIREFDLQDKIDMIYKGGVQIFGSEMERQGAVADLEYMQTLGLALDTVILSKEEMAEKLECENLYGGFFTKNSGMFWPRKFCAEMIEVVMARWADQFNLQTSTCVESVVPVASSGGTNGQADGMPPFRWNIKTPRGTVQARSVLHATNGWLCSLLPELLGTEDEVLPDLEMVIAARPSPAADSQGSWKYNINATNGIHYLVQMPPRDNRENVVIYGLGTERNCADDTRLPGMANQALHDMTTFLGHAFPTKFTARDDQGRITMDAIENVWSGIVGRTRDGSVVIGPVQGKKGQFTAAGYNGAGMVKCFSSGKVAASMIGSEFSKRGEEWRPPCRYPMAWLRHLDELSTTLGG